VAGYIASMGKNGHLGHSYGIVLFVLIYSVPVMLYHAAHVLQKTGAFPLARYEFLAYGAMLFLIVTNSGSPGSFIYFQF
jgi:alginate O-acetyltransferase complex protein AlgI